MRPATIREFSAAVRRRPRRAQTASRARQGLAEDPLRLRVVGVAAFAFVLCGRHPAALALALAAGTGVLAGFVLLAFAYAGGSRRDAG